MKIFLSHSTKNREFLGRLAAALESAARRAIGLVQPEMALCGYGHQLEQQAGQP
jgi:hypothetical protein